MKKMNNIFLGNEEKDFWVWVDFSQRMIEHQIKFTGCFISSGQERNGSNLMFLPNPDFTGTISPYNIGILSYYTPEYNLEIHREHDYPQYPSRLNAIYLLNSFEEAQKYKETHPEHVGNRHLRKVRTNGEYIYSIHDATWIDFLREPHSVNNDTINYVAYSYWMGEKVEQHTLNSFGRPWIRDSVMEVLFLGRIDFYDRSIPSEENQSEP